MSCFGIGGGTNEVVAISKLIESFFIIMRMGTGTLSTAAGPFAFAPRFDQKLIPSIFLCIHFCVHGKKQVHRKSNNEI